MKSILLSLLLLSTLSSFSQWTSDTLVNTQLCSFSNGAVSKVVPTGNGRYFVAYYGSMFGGYNMNLQLLDFDGNKLWAQNGVTISDHEQASWIADNDLVVDHADYAIVSFADIRNGNPDIFIYKMDQNAQQLWGEDGICLSSEPGDEYAPKACVLNDNSVIASWTVNDILKVQKIASDGTLAWGQPGISITESGKSFSMPVPLPDDEGGFYLTYFKQTGSFPAVQREIYVQRFDADGNPVWENDVELCGTTGISYWDKMYARKDNNNGVLVYWKDDRDGDMVPDVAIQRVDANGTPAFIPNGVELTSDSYNCYYPVAASLSDGSVVAFFTKTDGSQNYRGMYAQKVDPFGEKLWGNGIELFPLTMNFNYTIDVRVVDDNAFCLYSVFPDGIATNSKLYVYALDNEGNDKWEEPLTIAVGAYGKVHPFLSYANNTQMVVSWENGDNGKIMAQNFTTGGSTGVIPVGNMESDLNTSLIHIYGNEIDVVSPFIEHIKIYNTDGKLLRFYQNPKGRFEIQKSGLLMIVAQDTNGAIQVEKILK